jgi:hypothetical protein
MTIPLLAFTQRDFSLESLDESRPSIRDGRNPFNEWKHGDFVLAHMLGLNHGYLTSAFPRNDEVWDRLNRFSPEVQGDYGREDVIVGYGWMARYTLEFLNAYLKQDEAAKTFLKKTPAENGVPPHQMQVTFRAGAGIPASFDALRAEAGRQGFGALEAIYSEMKKEKSDFKPEAPLLSDWVTDLIDEHHLAEATSALEFECALYPDRATLYELLGDAYSEAGQTPQATDSYRKVLEVQDLDKYTQDKMKRKLAGFSATQSSTPSTSR